jgi:hypothetical protein
MIAGGLQKLLRAAAEALSNFADRADVLSAAVDPQNAAQEFAAVDLVGIDFSTSIQAIANHMIQGWDRYRRNVEMMRPDYGVWAFAVNAIPFPLTRQPVPPGQLPNLRHEHFRPRGCGQGLIEYGSAFYDYFLLALGHAQQLGVFDGGFGEAIPIRISLLCDGCPNGGSYQSSDVRPLVAEARARGVRFRVVGFTRATYSDAMRQFGDSLGLTRDELEVSYYDGAAPDSLLVTGSWGLLTGW